MSEWYSKYPNDDGEYEITFKSKNKDLTKAVEKVCCAIMDGVVKSRDDVDFLVRGRWIYHINDKAPELSTQECSRCHEHVSIGIKNEEKCPNCGCCMELVELED